MHRRSTILAVLFSLVTFADASAEGIRIGGRVVVPGGKPLAQADVKLLPLLDSLAESRAILVPTAESSAARALTDDEGRFQLLAPGAGLWRVRIAAQGFVAVESELQPLIEPVELPDAEVAPDAGLRVRVTGAQGAPLAGALVVVRTDLPRLQAFRSSWTAPARSATTGDDGIALLPRGDRERVKLSVTAAGHAMAEQSGLVSSAASVKLAAGKPVTLEVLSADGKPAGQVLLALGQRLHPLVLTDAAGRAIAHVDSAKPLTVNLLAPDGRRIETRLAAPAKPDGPPQRVSLPTLSSVSGRLIDADSRRPIEGGVVWDRANPAGGVTTDRAGGFLLRAAAGGRLEITSGAPGYMNGDPLGFQLPGTGRPGPTLALHPAAAIEGKITGPDGEPIAGAEVDLAVRENPNEMRFEIGAPAVMPRNLSGPRGEFRLSPVDPEQGYTVKVEADGFAPARESVSGLEPRRTKSAVNINLTRGQVVTGSVTDVEGHPLRDVDVELAPGHKKGPMGMMVMGGPAAPGHAFGALTDGAGKFAIHGIPAGQFDLTARRTGFAKGAIDAIELQPDSGPLDLGRIVLEPGQRLAGLVTDRDGRPIEGVEVHVSQGGPRMVMMAFEEARGPDGANEPDALSDPNGWFTVEDLAAGQKYTLELTRTGFVKGSIKAIEVPRLEPVNVALEAASLVSGRVVNGDGDPVAGARVNLSRRETMEMGGMAMVAMMVEDATSDDEGRFTFEDQRPGKISLSAVATGYQEVNRANLEIQQGQDLAGVELPLSAGGVIHGRVLAPDGRPAIGARVDLVKEGGDMVRMSGTPTDGNGYYRLEGLPPGPVSVEAIHADYPRAVKDLEVEEGLNSLDLSFEGGFAVEGRVVEAAGKPVAGALARLVPAGRSWGGPEASTKADGTFSMPGVQEGDYRLWVDAEGHAPYDGRQQVTVAGEPVYGLEVQLDPGARLAGKISGLAPELFGKVTVRAEGETFRGFDSGTVDHQGNYRVEHLLPGSYSVVASVADSGLRAKGEIEVEPGVSELTLDLAFNPGLTLSGRAVQGEIPVVGATVFVEGVDIEHTGWNETDADGEFKIAGLEPGSYEVNLRNFQSGLAYRETVQLGTSREIVLRVPTARISGRITDGADRQPLSGVTLILDAEEQFQGRFPTHTATTDLDGWFGISNVGDGSWRLSASKQGYAAVSQTVTVQYEKPVEDLKIPMSPTEGLTLETRLPSGSPPAEVRVAVLDPAGGALVSGSFATGENGRVRLSSVPAGTWAIVVSAAGSATSNLEARAPGAPIPVPLQPATSLRVVVAELLQSNAVAVVTLRDAAGHRFHALGWNGRPQNEWRMTGGQMEFGSLPPGSWAVSVATADGRTWQGSSVTTAGTPAELMLE